MARELPVWQNVGIKPPDSLLVKGWEPGKKPPAQYFNWYMNRAYLALEELQNHAINKNNPHNVTKSQVGLGNVQNYGIATKEEAEAGTSNSKYMTPSVTQDQINKSLEELVKHSEQLKLQETMNQYASDPDGSGFYRLVEFRRPNGTLYMTSRLDNSDVDGNYQNCEWTLYNEAGTSIIRQVVWKFTYDADGMAITKVVV